MKSTAFLFYSSLYTHLIFVRLIMGVNNYPSLVIEHFAHGASHYSKRRTLFHIPRKDSEMVSRQYENAHDHRGGQGVKNVCRIACTYTDNTVWGSEDPYVYQEDIRVDYILS